jgi:hypothetical protein
VITIIYSFNKKGFEARFWEAEIAAASTSQYQFVPFNHGEYLDPGRYIRAQQLDNLYYEQHPSLLKLYEDFRSLIVETGAAAVIVDNCSPYHPEFLRSLRILKVLRTSDGPLSAYDRDFAYLHAHDLVLYHSPAYSRDMRMAEKLAYCGAKESHLWPLALFDAMHDPAKDEDAVFSGVRDIELLFIGALFPNKMPLLASVKKTFGRRCRLHGLAGWKKNLYFNVKYGFPGWVSPIRFEQYVPLYQRTKIGVNVHNRGKYTVGGFRLFELPGNGVMQISDGGEYLEEFFKVGEEIESYENAEELIDKVKYYLAHDEARERIARAGYRRVMRDHRIRRRMQTAVHLISSASRSRDAAAVTTAQHGNEVSGGAPY